MNRSGDKPSIIIVGCGFGGIGLAVALKKAGIESFTILESANEIGGVWRDNSYPGAACDVPSRLYSFSFEQDYDWSGRFGRQAEILDYLRRCVDKYGIRPHIRFGKEVASAAFDAGSGLWSVETSRGESLSARVFVSSVGLFNRPGIPDLPGRDDFRGPQFHSARWDHDCDLSGKTVAVIGTGASAIQFVPAIAPVVKRLHVFQRSPQYVLPRADEAPPPGHGAWRRRLDRLRTHLKFESGIRRRGSPALTEKGERGFRDYLATQIVDPALREKLTPDYALGCKRVLQSNDWYAALQRPNVDLIDAPVEELSAGGVRSRDGQVYDVDTVIYGTGFTPTDYLVPMRVTGLDGRELSDAWRDGAEAYLGITVTGFPNFFMLYGPNTNTSGSIVFMLESQARYITRCIRALDRGGARYMNVRDNVQQAFNAEIQGRIGRTVLVQDSCHSYFRTASGKVTTQWPGFMFEYRRRTRRVRTSDYEFAPTRP